ncbi:hypothetical protein [uncultured Marinobacter sp.]|uniref:hypothetical protein n=1 Tax=uncultured Marinobacter sp. TaxID=187379 RepID=UPI002619CBF3|nr:hypothetical protein [uncultured Marinobacter sp.]
MRLIVYAFLMLLAIVFDAVQIINYWGTNYILLFSSIFVLLITLFLALLHLFNEEDWQLRWALFYTIPAGLLLVGSLSGHFGFQNQILVTVGQKPMPSLIPGTPSDYEGAVISHFVSMTFPFLARGLSAAIELALEMIGLTNRCNGRL